MENDPKFLGNENWATNRHSQRKYFLSKESITGVGSSPRPLATYLIAQEPIMITLIVNDAQ